MNRILFEFTPILQRIPSTIGLITSIQPSARGRFVSIGVQARLRTISIPRFQVTRIIWKSLEATNSHPVSTHWSSSERSVAIDKETFMASTPRYLLKLLLVFKDLYFQMLSVRSRFWCSKIYQTRHYIVHSTFVWDGGNSIRISSSSATTRHNSGWSEALLGITFSHPVHIGRILVVLFYQHYGRNRVTARSSYPTNDIFSRL